MGQKRKKYKPFVMLPKEMLRSKAWQTLSCFARSAYIEILLRFNGSNKDNLSFTYKEASKIMHRNTYAQVIRELVDHGFINVVRSGGLHNKPNIFSLSERWAAYGMERFVKGERVVVDPKWKP